jgi:hypothetical protein
LEHSRLRLRMLEVNKEHSHEKEGGTGGSDAVRVCAAVAGTIDACAD